MKIIFGLTVLGLLFPLHQAAAFTFTGLVSDDFTPESCFTDPGGRDIAFPATFPAGSSSGFDVEKICLVYDQPLDTLFVGVAPFDHPSTGQPTIFGDADGDGNPGTTSAPLTALGGADWPDLSTAEHFALILDFDNTTTTPPDVVAGISAQASAPTGFKVSTVALPHLGIDFAFENSYYGTLLTKSVSSALFANPSAAEPHLEFTITHFSGLPAFSNLDPDNPLAELSLVFKAGSLGDTVLGEEDIRLTLPPETFFDTDSDGTPDQSDTDLDNDGIPNTREVGDTDGDGIQDKRDTDSDNDGLTDLQEGDVDIDGDGIPNFQDTDSDNDSLSDREETLLGTDPTDPTDGSLLPGDQGTAPTVSSSTSTTQIQGSGPASCSLIASKTSHPLTNPEGVLGGLVFLLILFLRLHQKKNPLLGGFVVALLVGLAVSRPALALNVERFRPHFDHLGLLELSTSQTLEKNAWSAGTSLSYAHHPLEQSGGGTTTLLVNYQVQMALAGAYGITDWVEVGMVLPFFPAMGVDPTASGTTQGSASFGDIQLMGKFHLWDWHDEQEYLKMGVAVTPFLGFPSGSKSKFTADTNVTGGFVGSYDLFFGKNKFVTNVGLKFREKETLQNLSVGQEMLYGIGYTRPLWEPWDFGLVTELDGSFALNGLFSNSNRNPLEWLVGLRKGVYDSRLQITTGASFGISNGYGTPDFRVFSMVSYVAGPIQRKETREEPAPYQSYVRLEGGKIVILEPIHFETAKWSILPESLPVVQAIADMMKTQPQIRHVVVKGHTDGRGSDQANKVLSERRAQAVVKKLIEHGIDQGRLSSEGWGESQPITPNKTPAGMAKNRRVEFHITQWQQL